jgi:hypothetical protein
VSQNRAAVHAAKALLFLPNGVPRATAPAISVRREIVLIARPSGAPDLTGSDGPIAIVTP